MAKKKINNSLRDKFLIEHNLTKEAIMFEDHLEDLDSKERVLPIFRGDPYGNMEIYYPTLEKTWAIHYVQEKHFKSYRTRYAAPFTNTKGDISKYTMKGENRIFFPPEMLKAYHSKTQIETLIVTEGEKKAFIACKNGFDCVGISGIWNYGRHPDGDKNKQKELMPELKEFMKVCNVKNVVLLHDSDAMDISNSYFNQASNKSATERPEDFCESTKRFAELILSEGCYCFHSYINPHLPSEQKLGLDDLILKFETYQGTVDGITGLPILPLDLTDGVKHNKFTSYFITRQIQSSQNSFFKTIFKINDPDDFFAYHIKRFKEHNIKEFRFEKKLFEINYIEKKIKEIKSNEKATVWVKDRAYEATDAKGQTKMISNFTMNVLFLLKSGSNPKRIIEFENKINQKFVAEFTMDEMVSVSNFRKNLIAHGSFIFKGEMYDLLNLQEMLFRDEQVAIELTSLGWQKSYGFFAFANGLTIGGKFYPVDEYGVVTYHNEKYYLPAYSSLYAGSDEGYDNERKFKHTLSDVTFEDWSSQFYKVYGNNGAIAMCFGVSSMFYDILKTKFKMFPILNNFGVKGSGKSTCSESLMALFGEPQNAMSLESESSTKKGMFRKFMQFRNALVWLDEYKNTLDKRIIGFLKGLFDGHGYEKAQTSQDNRTHSTSINSATILSGQDMPTGEAALLSRVIFLQFLKTQFTDAEKQNMDKLREFEKKGLTPITVQVLAYREMIESQIDKEYNYWYLEFSNKFKLEDIDTRLIKSSCMVISPIAVLVKNKIVKLPFDLEELFAKFVVMMRYHKEISSKNSETNVFWDVVESLFNDKEISAERGDFKFVIDAIAIKMNSVYPKYAIKCRMMTGKNGIDKSTLINYLTNSAAFIETKNQIKMAGQNTSAYLFNYKMLGISLMRDTDEPAVPKSEEKIPLPAPLITETNGMDDFK